MPVVQGLSAGLGQGDLPLGRMVALAQGDGLVQGRRVDMAGAEDEDEAADGVGVVVESPVAGSHVAHGCAVVDAGMPPIFIRLVDSDAVRLKYIVYLAWDSCHILTLSTRASR